MTRQFLLITLFYGILALLVLPLFGRLIFSNDVFKALYSGRYLSLFRQFPHHSTFTFNPVLDQLSRDTFNWLGNMIIFGVFRTGGFTGLQVLRGILLLGTILLIHSLFRWNKHPIFLLLFFFISMSLSQKLMMRTAIFAVPGITLVLWAWIRARYDQQPQVFWFLPLILLIWSQLHGSYLLGVGLIILLFVGDTLDGIFIDHIRSGDVLLRYALITILVVLSVTFVKPFPDYSFLKRSGSISQRIVSLSYHSTEVEQSDDSVQRSTIGNPYAVQSVREAYGITGPARPSGGKPQTWYHSLRKQLQQTLFRKKTFRSEEYKFPLDRLGFLSIRSGLFLALLSILMLLLPPYRHSFSLWIPVTVFVIVGIGYIRTVGYLGLVPVLLASVKFRAPPDFFWNPPIIYTCFLAVSLLLGNIASLTANGTLEKLTGNPGHVIGHGEHLRMDSRIPLLLLEKFPDRRFFNSYDTGSYLIWHWWPRKKVFVDTKWTAYHPDFQEYATETPLPEILRDRNLNHAVFERGHFWRYHFNQQNDWTPITSNRYFKAYERTPESQPDS